MNRWKLAFIVVGALIVTALGIDAADTVSGSRSTLLAALAGTSAQAECPAGMVLLKTTEARVCVDSYEAGVGKACPVTEPQSVLDTLTNLEEPDCAPVSTAGVTPWRFVSYPVALQLCAKANKSLLTPAVWYQAALGTTDAGSVCATEGGLSVTGEHARCTSGSGAFDMVGNVWEFVQGEVSAGSLAGAALPPAGYVTAANEAGVAQKTAEQPNKMYGSDYFWSEASGTYAILRGGFYGGGSDAGIYSTQAATAPDFAGTAVGFRCMFVL